MIRAACPEDVEAITTVLMESRRVFLPFAPIARPDLDVGQWVRDGLVPGNRVFVWEEGRLVVAVLAMSAEQGESWIHQLYVLPGWNGKGIGANLLQHAHRTLPTPIHLYTFQQNAGARRFYERHGYTAVAFTDGQGNEEKCPDVRYVRSVWAQTTYRRATREDALCLSVLASQVFLDTYATNGVNRDLAVEVTSALSKQSFLERLERQAAELFVADHAGHMVGFIDLDFDSNCQDGTVTGVEVARLYVQRPFQRRNVGRALMALAEERARGAGHTALWLTAWAGNLAARDFYRILGFADIGATAYRIEGKEYENRILVKALGASAVQRHIARSSEY